MALSTRASGLADAAQPWAGPGQRRRYRFYGLDIRSDVALPGTPGADDPAHVADVDIRQLPAAQCPRPDGREIATVECRIHGAVMRVHRGPGGAWIWCIGLGTCHVHPDHRRADFYVEDDADPKALGMAVVGPVIVFILNMLRRPSLHASGIVLRDGAAVFLGPSGHGKSTMAAAFVRHGAALLGDDVLPIRIIDGTVCAEPSVPFMKIRRDSAEGALGICEELPALMHTSDKKLLQLEGTRSVASAPAPIRNVYLMNRYDAVSARTSEIRIDALSRRDGAAFLLSQTAFRRSMFPTEEAALLPLYAKLIAQAPVRVLSFPAGFEHQARLRERILAEMGAVQ